MATLEPVVIVARSDDLALLRQQLAGLPPLKLNRTAMTMNGWTDDMLALGRLLGCLADLVRSGDLAAAIPKEDDR